MSLSKLPDLPLLALFDLLDYKSIQVLRKTCHRLRELIDDEFIPIEREPADSIQIHVASEHVLIQVDDWNINYDIEDIENFLIDLNLFLEYHDRECMEIDIQMDSNAIQEFPAVQTDFLKLKLSDSNQLQSIFPAITAEKVEINLNAPINISILGSCTAMTDLKVDGFPIIGEIRNLCHLLNLDVQMERVTGNNILELKTAFLEDINKTIFILGFSGLLWFFPDFGPEKNTKNSSLFGFL